MKFSTISIILSIVVALMLPGVSQAGQLRLKRRNPIIEVGLGTVRNIAGPNFGLFKIVNNGEEQDGDDVGNLLDEEQDIYDSFSFSYEYSMSMSYPEPERPEVEVEDRRPLRNKRARQGRFRRKSGGLRGLR